ncbi:MAG: DNA gyrase subunit A [Kiritimatiellae bacterium]|nr:DNA gyrase subunit A [Kiritimatiellia bacterium]MDD3584062.1 DNA gyrase subunit A [Kiritimatiellia bacterium]
MSEEEIVPVSGEEPNVSPINIEDEMRTSYIDYSMSVIVGRALPDARDGLKPVHRRVLFTMHELGLAYNKAYKKSARVVGDTMGKYHPHGDSAIYDTLVRLAQDFSMRYPLVDGQGNFGSIDGDSAAAMRYTECRMDRLAEEMLADLDKDTVDFRPNYDEKEQEPVVLPSRLPNLLMNGSSGIAVGMATNIPPHNLGELVDGITYYVDNPDCTIDELMQFIKGPDFPTGGVICGERGIEAMYKLGRGSLMVRGKAEIVDYKNKEAIIITEIPYMVNKAAMIERMANLVNDKVIEGISDIRDESASDGIRVVIELKRGAIGQVVLNNLYKHTQLQSTFGAIMLAIDRGRPKVMTLKEMIRCHVDHRFDVLTRRTRFELDKAEARKHILDGLLIALDHLDEVVAIIRASKNRDEAKTRLVARFEFSDKQVDAILDMRLYQLTGLEREKVEAEFKALCERIAYLKDLLASPDKIYGLIKDDLADLKAKYVLSGKRGDVRRTDIVPMEGEVDIKDLIADEPCVITLSQRGYVKRVPLTTYREQRRGGRGITGAAIKEEDFITTVFVAETHDTLLLFTSQGRIFKKDAYEIPEAPRTSFGKPIVNLLELREGESVVALLPIRSFDTGEDVFFATENGIVKRTALADFRNVNRKGIIAIKFKDMPGDADDEAADAGTVDTDADTQDESDEQTASDRLIQVRLVNENDHILLVTADGKAIRFPVSFKRTDADGTERETSVRCMGRASAGVRGIRLAPGDVVRSFDIVNDQETLLIATENGYGKRTEFSDFSAQHRGGGGVIAIKGVDERNGRVVAAHAVREDQSFIAIASNGMMVRSPVNEVRIIGRAAKGVRLVNLAEDATLVSVSIADPDDDDE